MGRLVRRNARKIAVDAVQFGKREPLFVNREPTAECNPLNVHFSPPLLFVNFANSLRYSSGLNRDYKAGEVDRVVKLLSVPPLFHNEETC